MPPKPAHVTFSEALTNDVIWYRWTTSTASTSTLTLSVGDTFDSSSTATTIDYYATSPIVWSNWCNTIVVTGTLSGDTMHFERVAPAPLTPEQVMAAEARAAAARERNRVAEQAQRVAEDRAEKLLLECLSLRQRVEYLEKQFFTVHAASGKRYRIRRGTAGNIDEVDKKGRVTAVLCAHPNIHVPHQDAMLAQKLHLEHDESAFVRLANRRSVRDGDAVLPVLH